MAIHPLNRIRDNEILQNLDNSFTDSLDITFVKVFDLSHSDYNLEELVSAKRSVLVFHQINDFNIGSNKNAINCALCQILVNDFPLEISLFKDSRILT